MQELRKEVLDTSACTGCGSCVGICPYVVSIEDRIAAIADCRIPSGKCYLYCPRTSPFPEAECSLGGDVGYRGPVGTYREYCMARSTFPRDKSSFQYGGVVSTLLIKALQEGLIDCAIVTRAANNFPLTVTALSREEILEAAGSRFALAPTNKEVNRSSDSPGNRLGVVALPCQCTGLRKRQLLDEKEQPEGGRLTMVVGLFCTWALSQKGWRSVLHKHWKNESIDRVDIPPPPAGVLEIASAREKVAVPLEETREFVPPGCDVCLDMTAENADISVGMVEGLKEYSTVIIRTERGSSLFEMAVKAGCLEKTRLDDERWNHLLEASLNKKKRAVGNAEDRAEALPYYERIKNLRESIERRE
ncbi:MAG: Coenzyme F420 hydrogenase/dehydrogenase, beta subunit C-terminal domain [Dehalococcoidia bacterium]